MKDFVVWLPRSLDRAELQSFVDEAGGYWLEEPTLDRGVIARGAATIYLDLLDRSIDPVSDVEGVAARWGVAPEAWIDIHVGHGGGSEELALETVRTIVARWNGWIEPD